MADTLDQCIMYAEHGCYGCPFKLMAKGELVGGCAYWDTVYTRIFIAEHYTEAESQKLDLM